MSEFDNARVVAASVDSTQSLTAVGVASDREGLILWNDSTQVCYVLLGSLSGAASSTNCSFKLAAGERYESPGGMDCSCEVRYHHGGVDASGKLRVTELI